MAALALTTGIAGAHVVDHALAQRRGRATDKRVGRRCNGSGGGGRDRVRRGGARYGGPVSPEVSPDEVEHLDLRSTRSTPGSLTLQMVAIPRPRLCPRAAGCLVATSCCCHESEHTRGYAQPAVNVINALTSPRTAPYQRSIVPVGLDQSTAASLARPCATPSSNAHPRVYTEIFQRSAWPFNSLTSLALPTGVEPVLPN